MTVLPFRRASAAQSATYALVGKLPNRADFVRINSAHAAAAEFDELIQQTFERLTSEGGWEGAYDESRPVEFQYVSRDRRHTFLGILAPSRDQAGRRYPLVAGAILPCESIAGYGRVAPIAYEVFFDGLRDQVLSAIENSVEALSCREFLESQLRARDTAVADLELAEGVVERFLKHTPAVALNGLLAEEAQSARLEQTLLNLAFYRAFLRRFDTPATNQLIVLPLPPAKGERALAACAWLTLLDALWRGKRSDDPWHGSFAVIETPSGAHALATVFDKMQDRFGAAMLGGSLESPGNLELSREQAAWTNHRLYPEVSYALGRLLAESGLTLSTLCDFLEDVGKKLEDGI